MFYVVPSFYMFLPNMFTLCTQCVYRDFSRALPGLSPDSAVLSDGTQLNADLVVLATGYRPLNEAVQKCRGGGNTWGLEKDDN